MPSSAVQITGVLIDLRLSCTRVITKDARTEYIVRTQEPMTTYNNVVQPPSPIKLTAPRILIDGESTNMVVGQPLSTLPSGRNFTAHFTIPKTHSLVDANKKHQAELKDYRVRLERRTTEANAKWVIQAEDLKRAQQNTSKSSRRKKRKKARLVEEGSAPVSESVSAPISESVSMSESISTPMSESISASMSESASAPMFSKQFTSEIDELKVSRTQQVQKIWELEDSKATLSQKILGLEDSNATLSADNKSLTATVQRHSIALHALHRRVVLDDARDLIRKRYKHNINDLRLGRKSSKGSQRRPCSNWSKKFARSSIMRMRAYYTLTR
ncbi:uncharacterized protein F5147DRAFT_837802 [Suillus discolor]|uniref:Uncharacterized protein n=1 Tax=Suillus discolor TaxID=1912936 RepID=A0A9P7JSX6_9AGAM|nr:uncharacterized protein F5147DRAFT_837802 [Suillus discolor]KAG2106572.1 hypothetical protein F5147DRAFT_837802 [Suillus discolor]